MDAPSYNGLTQVEPTLPSSYYIDPAHHERELEAIWYRDWLYLCRADALPDPRSYRTFDIGSQQVLLVRDNEGTLRAFHNTCRHRGSVLCPKAEGRLRSGLITCPYHSWSYDLDGALVRAPTLAEAVEFDLGAYRLYDVALAEWGGFVFANLLGKEAPPFEGSFDKDSESLDNWPLEDLVVGHVFEKTMACNWKVFWENFNECLHCPGLHPELSELVPIYNRAIMMERDDPNWASHGSTEDPKFKGGLREGARTWSMDGEVHGPELPGLSDRDRAAGHTYVMNLPTFFAVGHVDYVRTVRLRPLGPEQTELRAEWLFSPEALADPAFDLANIVDFATLVMEQDATACELNQRGLHSLRHEAGVLMPEEYAVHQFHQWVRGALESMDVRG